MTEKSSRRALPALSIVAASERAVINEAPAGSIAAMRATGLRTIGQASKLSGMTVNQIRDFTQAGLLDEPQRADNGYAMYAPRDIYRMNFILRAMRVGLDSERIAVMLRVRGTKHADACIATLEQRAQLIAGLINDMKTPEPH